MRLDLHDHTCFSKDSSAPIASVVRRCLQAGLDVVAVTDHDNIRGALEVLPWVDMVEGFNGHTVIPWDNSRAERFAREHGLPLVASSDAHSALELGRTLTEVPAAEFDATPQGLLGAVKQGSIIGKYPNPFFYLTPGYARLRKVFA